MYLFLLLFLIVIFLLGQRKEHMESRQLLGPKPDPMLYDPTYKYPGQKELEYVPAGTSSIDQMGPNVINRPPLDDGTFRSDTATQQYSVFFFKPFAELPFPTSPPPQPFLNDFSPFQR
jgi:hypothetical protein